MNSEVEMVLTYVPEAEWMSWDSALHLAHARDAEAARQFLWSMYD